MLCIIPRSHLGLSLNYYQSRMISIKYHLNIKCHEICHVHSIRCKDLILISCTQSGAKYFELHKIK
jgi:hypothetical protein